MYLLMLFLADTGICVDRRDFLRVMEIGVIIGARGNLVDGHKKMFSKNLPTMTDYSSALHR